MRLIRAEISSLPLEDGAADLCFCMRLFHHMRNDEVRLGALRELARVSRGYVAFSFYNQHCLRYYQRSLRGKKRAGHHVTFSHMRRLTRQVGLELVERWPKLNLMEMQCCVILQKA